MVLVLGAVPASAILVRLPNGKVLGYEPLRGRGLGSGAALAPGTLTRRSSKFDPALSNLDYSGGPVMPSNKNYTIVWNPVNYTGTKFQTGYTEGIATYFKDIQAATGANSNSDAVAPQYNDSLGNVAAYNSEFKSVITDTDPLPASGCIYAPAGGACLTDAQLQAEIEHVLTVLGLPRGLTNEYFMLTPPDVASCFGASSSCSANATNEGVFCAYHSASPGSTSFIYSNMPDVAGNTGCDPYTQYCGLFTECSYINSVADGELSVLSHEHTESVTDPQPNNAWTDWQPCSTGAPQICGGEIGDKCAHDELEGPEFEPNEFEPFRFRPFDTQIGTRKYLIQREWSNRIVSGEHCLGKLVPNGHPALASFATAVSGLTASLNAGASTATGGVAHYVWQFNDDVIPGDTPQVNTEETSSQTMTHTFPATGTYNVALTVMGPDGTSNGTAHLISVTAPPPTPPPPAISVPVSTGSSPGSGAGSGGGNTVVLPNSNFSAAVASVNSKNGTLTVTETVSDPGSFSWLLTFQNGKFGAFSASNAKCKSGTIKLGGKCRPAKITFAKGSQGVAGAGTVRFVLKPSASGLKALKNALKQKKGLVVTETFTFQSARGGSPVSHTQSVLVKLKK
jgi:hypothetical protein